MPDTITTSPIPGQSSDFTERTASLPSSEGQIMIFPKKNITLIVGLGNPGEKYEPTRHNAGFMCIDRLIKKWGFPEPSFNKKFNAEISEGSAPIAFPSEKAADKKIPEGKIILAKPQTFMNRSGQAVKKIVDFYKLSPANIVVVHDDLDIEIGKCKLSTGASAAGHKGVQSVINHLGTQDFKRFRIGVEMPGGRENRATPGDRYVLEPFSPDEMDTLEKIFNKSYLMF